MMRVTNSMIVRRSKTNINANRAQVDRTNNQMATQKKIVKPSDNPIIAIRSLRLRSALSTITQYYENNIPDTESWMDVTETALTNMKDIVTNAYEQVVYGSTDSLNQDNRKTIQKELKALQEQIYSEGDSDYAGRTVFTGYKTNQTLTFLDEKEAQDAKYQITERFNFKNIEQKKYYQNNFNDTSTDKLFAYLVNDNGEFVDENGIPLPDQNDTEAYVLAGPDMFDEVTLNRVRLSYDEVTEGKTALQFNMKNGDQTVAVKYTEDADKKVSVQGIVFPEDDAVPDPNIAGDYVCIESDPPGKYEIYAKKDFKEEEIENDADYNRVNLKNDAEPAATVTAKMDEYGDFDHWQVEAGKGSLELTYRVSNTTELEENNYELSKNEIVLNTETGELIFDHDVAEQLNREQSIFTFTYDKQGFEIGELRPENYFDCVKTVSDKREITYTNYTDEGDWITEAIYYNIAGGQQMQINTEARDVFNSDIRRDMDDLIEIVQTAIGAQETVDDIQKKIDSGIYDDDPDKMKTLNDWLDMAKKQLSYANQNMHDTYSAYITKFQDYLEDVNLAITDIGGRGERVSLTKNRMSIQESTFKDLKSTNEDMDLSELVINYSAASVAYQAALQAAAKIDKMTLLNYL